jgi:hypothetical protein
MWVSSPPTGRSRTSASTAPWHRAVPGGARCPTAAGPGHQDRARAPRPFPSSRSLEVAQLVGSQPRQRSENLLPRPAVPPRSEDARWCDLSVRDQPFACRVGDQRHRLVLADTSPGPTGAARLGPDRSGRALPDITTMNMPTTPPGGQGWVTLVDLRRCLVERHLDRYQSGSAPDSVTCSARVRIEILRSLQVRRSIWKARQHRGRAAPSGCPWPTR